MMINNIHDLTVQNIVEMAQKLAQEMAPLIADRNLSDHVPADADAIRAEIEDAKDFIPSMYGDFIRGVEKTTDFLIRSDQEMERELLVGAITQHAPGHPANEIEIKELKRFLIVVGDLFSSFSQIVKRKHIDVLLLETIVPLATFHHLSTPSPLALSAKKVQETIQGDPPVYIGVVSLPSEFRKHPVLWAELSHETVGHIVIQADGNLLQELQNGIYEHLTGSKMPFSSSPQGDKERDGLLWAYWIDEASADVFGLMNMGPAFALNGATFLSAFLQISDGYDATKPKLRTSYSGNPEVALNKHPVDVLRLGLAIGVIEKLDGLEQEIKDKYIELLQEFIDFAVDSDTVKIVGTISTTLMSESISETFNKTYPFDEAMTLARTVGNYVATASFKSLADNSIQRIETWADFQESITQSIASDFLEKSHVTSEHASFLISGATMALLQNINQYDGIITSLNNALDELVTKNKLWGNSQ